MSEARWRQVKALFQATLERPPAERPAFLAAATGDDDELRREVESLLDSDDTVDFTDRLPGPHLRPLIGSDFARLPSGDQSDRATTITTIDDIGPYRVTAWLGAGGMGEVFRAHDSTLKRDVALKVLPSVYALDVDRLARFSREAQALAALNHPHIAAIYGLEESNGRQALVLELVDGVTLADRIRNGALSVVDALTMARQIADALDAAHQKGIVHRDLKPANVKVTPAGVVKVLDFGLAKAAGDPPGTGVSQSQCPTSPDQTRVGLVLGTAGYMSPEQARGEKVDARTDIWAFGCVLFEMLSGGKAFGAEDGRDPIAQVLDDEPDWRRLPKNTPAEIRRLLRQCLAKDPARRLQTIAHARAIIERVLAPRTSAWWMWAAIAAAAVFAAAVGTYLSRPVNRAPVASRAEWLQMTSLDSVTQPAVSPDGRMIAFIRGPDTFVSPGQVYVKALPDGEAVALTNDNLAKMSPVFSPDGSRVAYTVNDGNTWDTWQVATRGGRPRHWLRNASGLTWMGANDLLLSEVRTGAHMAIVKSSDGSAASRNVYVPPRVTGMAHRSYASPDKKWVLVVEMDSGVWISCRLVLIDGGVSQPIGPPKSRCTDAAWSPDGRWMYFSADAGDGFHVWRQRFPDGEPEQVTSGPTEEQGLALAPDGKSLITSVGLVQRSVWLRDGASDRQMSLEGYAFWPLLSVDGEKLLFRVTRGVGSGQSPSELWMVDVRSGERSRLFPNQLVSSYDVSRDNRIVATVVGRDGRSTLWTGWLDGREAPRRIPEADGDNPRFGRDGEILFRVGERDSENLYRIRADGTGREKITQVAGTVFGITSPDGEWLSATGLIEQGLLLYSTRGQMPRRVFPSAQASRLRWSLDGKRAYLSIQYGQASAFAVGRTYVLPLAPGSVLPAVPPGGFRTEAELAAVPGVEIIPYGDAALGPNRSIYAYSRVTTTRNLYRITLR